jgi:ABC-type Fe3+ transport system permease subunit
VWSNAVSPAGPASCDLQLLLAAFSFALSMGELGATMMVYPPGWLTIPVGIFALTDRGDVFDGAALIPVPERIES